MILLALDFIYCAAADVACHAAFLFDLVYRVQDAAAERVYLVFGEVLRNAGPVLYAGVGAVYAGVVVGGSAGSSELAYGHGAAALGMLYSHFVCFKDAGLIGDVYGLLAAADDGFQILGTHDSAGAAAGCGTVAVADDGCHVGFMLAAGPDDGNAHIGGADLFFYYSVGFGNGLSPDVRAVAESDLFIGNIEVDGFFGDAFAEDGVIAGLAHLRAEAAACAGVAPAFGGGRLADY